MRVTVNAATAARISAYVLLCVIAGTVALAANGRAVPAEAWREALDRAEAALTRGDVGGAQQAWQEAYRAARAGRSPEGLLDVGSAYLRIGRAAHDRGVAVAQARRLYLVALFRARERGDADAAARAGEAFAALGDREVADRAFDVAMALATQNRDAVARDRIAALRARSAYTAGTP